MENLFVNRIRLNKDNIDNSKYPFNIKCLSDFEELKNVCKIHFNMVMSQFMVKVVT